MKDFSKYKFRASQMHKLMVGNIGLSPTEKDELKGFLQRKMGNLAGELDEKGKPYKPLPPGYATKLEVLLQKKKENALPLTMKKEIRKIYRSEKYNRNFLFTNKYVQKGIQQEEESITLYQKYRKDILGINTLFSNNKERLENDFISGEWDLTDNNDIKKSTEVFDIKTSWSLESFPFSEDELDDAYYWQNMCYMWLLGYKKSKTVYCLVNSTEQQVFNEKQKHFYALGMPDQDDKYWDEYVSKCRDIEKMLIYDYDRFVDRYNPNIEIQKDEWFGEGYDIPLEERVIEKSVTFDQEKINEMMIRIKVARKYLVKLQKDES